MKTILISEFKTHCVGLLNEVHDTGSAVLVTKRGRPLAKVVPVPTSRSGRRTAGDCAGQVGIFGEIVATDSAGDWESLEA